MSLEQKIIDILTANKVPYKAFEHEPVYTNPAMAEALKVAESQTVKSIVAETKEKKMIVIVLPGSERINWKLTASCADTKKISFAKLGILSQPGGGGV